MKLKSFLTITVFSIMMCHNALAQVKVFETFEEFEQTILKPQESNTVYVINFWATWCAPCVKELPYFEELNTKYKNGNFKQYLVTLDDKKKMNSRVLPFLEKNKIESEVVLLADGKANKWIDRVDPSWSGAIPITIILKGSEKLFYEREFHSMIELENELKKLL